MKWALHSNHVAYASWPAQAELVCCALPSGVQHPVKNLFLVDSRFSFRDERLPRVHLDTLHAAGGSLVHPWPAGSR